MPNGTEVDLSLVTKALDVLPEHARCRVMGQIWIRLQELKTPEGQLRVLRKFARHVWRSEAKRTGGGDAGEVGILDETELMQLLDGLTGRDADVVRLLAQGNSMREVGAMLQVSRVTVWRTVKRISRDNKR